VHEADTVMARDRVPERGHGRPRGPDSGVIGLSPTRSAAGSPARTTAAPYGSERPGGPDVDGRSGPPG